MGLSVAPQPHSVCFWPPQKCAAAPYCGNSQFSDDTLRSVFVQVPVICFGRVSRSSAGFLNWVACFLVVTSKRSLYTSGPALFVLRTFPPCPFTSSMLPPLYCDGVGWETRGAERSRGPRLYPPETRCRRLQRRLLCVQQPCQKRGPQWWPGPQPWGRA